jgi:hypothetical protein
VIEKSSNGKMADDPGAIGKRFGVTRENSLILPLRICSRGAPQLGGEITFGCRRGHVGRALRVATQ